MGGRRALLIGMIFTAISVCFSAAAFSEGVPPVVPYAGTVTNAWFEWGTDPALSGGTATSTQGAGSGSAPVAMSAPVLDLQRNTAYFFRMVADNGGGPVRGQIVRFTTTESPGTSRNYVLFGELGMSYIVGASASTDYGLTPGL